MIVLLLFALFSVGQAGHNQGHKLHVQASGNTVSCFDPRDWCELKEGVFFKFSDRPVAGRIFSINVIAPQNSRVSAYFNMRGMDMGTKAFDLHVGDIYFRDVILPICPTGDADWFVEITVDEDRYIYDFESR